MVLRRYGTGDASPRSTVRIPKKRTMKMKNLMIASIVIVLLLMDECDDTAKDVGSKEAKVVVMSKRDKQEGFVERTRSLFVLW